MHHLACQSASVCISLRFVYTLIIGLLLASKPQNMIIILEFPNGKMYTEKYRKM